MDLSDGWVEVNFGDSNQSAAWSQATRSVKSPGGWSFDLHRLRYQAEASAAFFRAWIHRTQKEIDGVVVFDSSSAGPIGRAHSLSPSPGPFAFSASEKRNRRIVKSGLLLLQTIIPDGQSLCVSDYGVEPHSLLPSLDFSSAHILQRVGYVDLNWEEHQIFSHIDKSVQKIIRKSKQEFTGELRVIDSSSPLRLIEAEIGKAEALHAEVSGRRTRPSSSWIAMIEMVLADRAFFLGARLSSSLDSYLFAVTDGSHSAVGGSQVSTPVAKKIGIRHRLEWEMILLLKARGYRFYEVGRIFSQSHPFQMIDEKLSGIGRYKGRISPLVGARLVSWIPAAGLSPEALWEARSVAG